MKTTLSLKKPLSFEQQAKIFQRIGLNTEPIKKKQQENSDLSKNSLKKKKNIFAFIDWLAKTYPQCFKPKNPKPLKKGIIVDILEQGLWTESKTSLKVSLAFYVSSPAYHQAILQEKSRYDLEGKAVGEITEIEKEFSKQRLSLLKKKRSHQKSNDDVQKSSRHVEGI